MTVIYGVVLIAGLLAIGGWVMIQAAGSEWDPARWFGTAGRRWSSAAVGFGMGGLSASFAGWGSWPAVLAALLAAGALAVLAGRT